MKAIKILTAALVVTFALALGAGRAAADPKQDAEAKRLYEEGTKFYSLGDFPRAIEAYKKGFELKPDAVFLYNIAQAYRLSKRFEDALFFYKSFLRNLPGAVNRAEVEKRIEEMNGALQKQQETADSPPTGPVAPGTGGARTGTSTSTSTGTSTGDGSAGSSSGGEAGPAGGKVGPAGGDATRSSIPSPGETAGASAAGEEQRTPPPARVDSGGGGSRPIYKKWWFWAGIGAVAVGTAAVIVATSGGGDSPDSHFGTIDVY
ncbi:MAG: tetratricopeptide repeat protein [Deltaproteobacteria bacterium]|nr:tetratricopeptide repeat protein [Deltaproteobacteria bacterium]